MSINILFNFQQYPCPLSNQRLDVNKKSLCLKGCFSVVLPEVWLHRVDVFYFRFRRGKDILCLKRGGYDIHPSIPSLQYRPCYTGQCLNRKIEDEATEIITENKKAQEAELRIYTFKISPHLAYGSWSYLLCRMYLNIGYHFICVFLHQNVMVFLF